MHIANSDRPVEFYNLEVIISVGYRVKSQSTENYDSLLNGWIEHINTRIAGEFIVSSRYSRNAEAARKKLESYIFIISDGGLDPDYPLLTTTEAADTTGES